MIVATITSKGQVTVPKTVRDRLRLRTGDRIEFRLLRNGTFQVVPASTRTDEAFGMLSAFAKGKKLSVSAMHLRLRQAFREKRP